MQISVGKGVQISLLGKILKKIFKKNKQCFERSVFLRFFILFSVEVLKMSDFNHAMCRFLYPFPTPKRLVRAYTVCYHTAPATNHNDLLMSIISAGKDNALLEQQQQHIVYTKTVPHPLFISFCFLNRKHPLCLHGIKLNDACIEIHRQPTFRSKGKK